MNPNTLSKMVHKDKQFQALTGLPSLLRNDSVSACIQALNKKAPIHPHRTVKGEIRARYGDYAVRLMEQVYAFKRLDKPDGRGVKKVLTPR